MNTEIICHNSNIYIGKKPVDTRRSMHSPSLVLQNNLHMDLTGVALALELMDKISTLKTQLRAMGASVEISSLHQH